VLYDDEVCLGGAVIAATDAPLELADRTGGDDRGMACGA